MESCMRTTRDTEAPARVPVLAPASAAPSAVPWVWAVAPLLPPLVPALAPPGHRQDFWNRDGELQAAIRQVRLRSRGWRKDLLDWKKQQTQKQGRGTGRGTYYIDQELVQNKVQLLTAGVQSIFDIATSLLGPPDGLMADVLRGLKNVGQKVKRAGSDFVKGAEHDIPKAPAAEPPKPPKGEPEPESDVQTCLSDGTTELSVAQKGFGNFARFRNFAAVKKCGPRKGGGNKPKPPEKPKLEKVMFSHLIRIDDSYRPALPA
jgi:hypothetical protein